MFDKQANLVSQCLRNKMCLGGNYTWVSFRVMSDNLSVILDFA